MKAQYKWYERLFMAIYNRMGKIQSRINEREDKRREALALLQGTIIRCDCPACKVVNPSGRLWRVDSYDPDCDQYKAFATDNTKLMPSQVGPDRDYFKDGHFEVVNS